MTDLDPIDVHIGEVIRAARHARGLSSETLASAIGIPVRQLQTYEKGTDRISVAPLFRIAAVLGLRIADFFPKKGDRSEPFRSAGREDRTAGHTLERMPDPCVRQGLHSHIDAVIPTGKDVRGEQETRAQNAGDGTASAGSVQVPNIRYAHDLYDLAERIAADHPRAAQHLEQAADQLVRSVHRDESDR